MNVAEQSLMQRVFADMEDSDCVGVRCRGDTISSSTPCGSDSSDGSSDHEGQAHSLTDKTPKVKTSDKWRQSNAHGRKKGKKAQGPHKQKKKHTANQQVLKLPPIKTPQVSKPGLQFVDSNCIRELNNQVLDLQQQLSEAKAENKLLKRLQHRHMVALQYFQDSEASLPQILTKHWKEVQVLRGLLHGTRTRCDKLQRKLQITEESLRSKEASLQHLQMLSQDHSLLAREELTVRLTRASAELEDKDKRILDLEKNLQLCQASFNRQIVAEQRKINKARKTSCYLQEQSYQLNQEIQDRQRELETHNIYSLRFLKGSSKKGSVSKTVQTESKTVRTESKTVQTESKTVQTESRTVQTDGLGLLSTEAESLVEAEERLQEESSVDSCCYSPVRESLVIGSQATEVSANVTFEENDQEDPGTCADTNEQRSCSEESPEYQTEGDSAEEQEAPHELEEEWITEEHESKMPYISEQTLNATKPKSKGSKLPKLRRNYSFKQTTKNLHIGRPAYSCVDLSSSPSTKSPVKADSW